MVIILEILQQEASIKKTVLFNLHLLQKRLFMCICESTVNKNVSEILHMLLLSVLQETFICVQCNFIIYVNGKTD